jgi:hypothetical protein
MAQKIASCYLLFTGTFSISRRFLRKQEEGMSHTQEAVTQA